MLHIDEETRTHWYGATLKSLLPCLTTGAWAPWIIQHDTECKSFFHAVKDKRII